VVSFILLDLIREAAKDPAVSVELLHDLSAVAIGIFDYLQYTNNFCGQLY